MSSILIKNATIITVSPQGVIENGWILIQDSRIAGIGSGQETEVTPDASRQTVIDAGGKIVMPGLIDAHSHMCQQLKRGLRPLIFKHEGGGARAPYWKNYLIPFERLLEPEDVLLSAQVAAANMVSVGTTCVSEHGGWHPQMMAQGIEQVGIRGLLTISTMDMDVTSPYLPEGSIFTTEEAIAKNLAVVEQWPFRGDGLVRGCFSLRQIIVCTPELIKAIVQLADEHDTMVQTHLAEGTYEIDFSKEQYNARPTEYLENLGALSPRLIVAHAVLLSDREVELFAEYGLGISHCPKGNLSWLGMAKLPLMRRLGVDVGIGSDGGSGGSIDLFNEMRISLVAQHLSFGVPFLDRTPASPSQVLEMATIGGARVMGLEDEIGSLETGKRADLIILEPNLDALPINDPVATVVDSLCGRDVETVIVNGQILMRDKQLLTVDEEGLKQQINQRVPQIHERFLQNLERR